MTASKQFRKTADEDDWKLREEELRGQRDKKDKQKKSREGGIVRNHG